MTDTITYLTEDELGCNSAFGVPCDWVGEDGDMVAVTADRRRGLAAIHAIARHDLRWPACCTGVETGWARFSPGAGDPQEWTFRYCEATDPGALPVVVAFEVGEARG